VPALEESAAAPEQAGNAGDKMRVAELHPDLLAGFDEMRQQLTAELAERGNTVGSGR